jgi:hypothetical protein
MEVLSHSEALAAASAAARASVKHEDSSDDDEYASSDSEALSPWSAQLRDEANGKTVNFIEREARIAETLQAAAIKQEQQPEQQQQSEEPDDMEVIEGKKKKKKRDHKHSPSEPLPPVRDVSIEQDGEEEDGKRDERLAVNKYLSIKKKGINKQKKVWPRFDWFKKKDDIKRHEPKYYAICEEHWQAESEAKQVAYDDGLALEEFWPRWNRLCQSPGQPQLTGRFESSPELCAALGHWHDCGKKKERYEENLVVKWGPTGSNQVKRTLESHFEEISPNPWVEVVSEDEIPDEEGEDDEEGEEEAE